MKNIITKLDQYFNNWPYHKDSDLEVPGTPLTWKEFYALYKVAKGVEEHTQRINDMFNKITGSDNAS